MALLVRCASCDTIGDFTEGICGECGQPYPDDAIAVYEEPEE